MDNVKGDCAIGGGEGRGNRRRGNYGTSANSSSHAVKLTLEGIYERGGYNRSVSVFSDSCLKGRLSSKAPTRTL